MFASSAVARKCCATSWRSARASLQQSSRSLVRTVTADAPGPQRSRSPSFCIPESLLVGAGDHWPDLACLTDPVVVAPSMLPYRLFRYRRFAAAQPPWTVNVPAVDVSSFGHGDQRPGSLASPLRELPGEGKLAPDWLIMSRQSTEFILETTYGRYLSDNGNLEMCRRYFLRRNSVIAGSSSFGHYRARLRLFRPGYHVPKLSFPIGA